MSVTEHERRQLFTWFEEHMGAERAESMMRLLPPVGWGDIATRRDVNDLRRDLIELEARLDAKMDAKLGALRGELLRTFGTWLFASQAAVIAAVSLLVAVLALTL
jgi:hypothetical protein